MPTQYIRNTFDPADLQCIDLPQNRLNRAKAAFSTRNVDFTAVRYLLSGKIAPQAGDLVLATVKRIGQHRRIELASGRRAHLFPSDEIILAYGNRYAPDQFEGIVPDSLKQCHMVAAGGIAAKMVSKHNKFKNATTISPLGLLAGDDKTPLNLRSSVITQQGPDTSNSKKPMVLGIVGSSMNAGKTTMAGDIIHGLSKSGLRVGAVKLTGTASGGDLWLVRDAGAWPVYDFTDAGFASTYQCHLNELKTVTDRLMCTAYQSNNDVIVVEIADGLLQQETAMLLANDFLHQHIHAFMLAAADSMGAESGIRLFRHYQTPLIGVGGRLSASSLMTKETELISDIPVYDSTALQNSLFLNDLKSSQRGSNRLSAG